ncbi:MAG: HAMP domain-containing protein [Planctomycetes bacterium]|nr:HAMP domain-containing protein [Planctomycetota bacterium]
MSSKIKLFWWIFIPFFFITLISVFVVASTGSWRSRQFFLSQQQVDTLRLMRGMKKEIERRLETESTYMVCSEVSRRINMRITLVDLDGKVLEDTHEESERMDLHNTRPELVEAMAKGEGQSMRYSKTVGSQMIYTATQIDVAEKKMLLRFALPLPQLDEAIDVMYSDGLQLLVLLLVAMGLLVWFVAKRLSYPLETLTRIVMRISEGDSESRLKLQGAAEFQQLSVAINTMSEQIFEKIATIVQQRNQIEAVLGSMKEGVIALSKEGKVSAINPAAYSILHFKKNIAVQDRPLGEILRSRKVLECEEKLRLEGEEFEIEIEVGPSGDSVLQVRGSRIEGDESEAHHSVLVFSDISRMRKLENMRRDFVSNVSHELKTPLTSIMGYAETLAGQPEFANSTPQRFLGKIEHNALRLHRIIEDLLTLSRIEQTGLPEGELKKQLLPSLMQRLKQDLSAEQQSRVLFMDVESVNLKVHGPLLHQALFNLIDNGLKYSGEEGAVEIDAQVDNDAGEVTFSVSDNGPGIHEVHVNHLTERFYRVDKARSSDSGGTGLGLSIVKHIVEAHGGSLKIESTPRVGSQFFLTIPLGDDEEGL